MLILTKYAIKYAVFDMHLRTTATWQRTTISCILATPVHVTKGRRISLIWKQMCPMETNEPNIKIILMRPNEKKYSKGDTTVPKGKHMGLNQIVHSKGKLVSLSGSNETKRNN